MSNQNIYLAGEGWLYFRIYTGCHTSDNILARILHPLASNMIKEGSAESWFFIRYADPDYHLRFRIKLLNTDEYGKLISELNLMLKPYVSQGLVWKVEVSGYHPEYERYGRHSMAHAEQIFYADSVAFVHFKELESKHEDIHLRWLYALASAAEYLNEFKLTSDQKKDLLLGLSRSFGKEFSKDKHLAKQLSAKYRQHRNRIYNLLENDDEFKLLNILEQRSKMSEIDVRAIIEMYSAGKIEVPIKDLLSSFIHMTMNRIFQNNNRLHEMVLYDFLFRHFKSKMAMQMVS